MTQLFQQIRDAVKPVNWCLEAVLGLMRAVILKFLGGGEGAIDEERLDPVIHIDPVPDGVALPIKEQVCSFGVLVDLGLFVG